MIVLSARGEERSKIEALELGADDYVTKPFAWASSTPASAPCCVAPRARRPRRRVGSRPGPVVLDTLAHEVTVGGRRADLTPREFEILRVLLANPGRLVTHGRLLRAVWGEAYQGERHYVHVHVSTLRRKLAALDPTGARALADRHRAGRRVPRRAPTTPRNRGDLTTDLRPRGAADRAASWSPGAS